MIFIGYRITQWQCPVPVEYGAKHLSPSTASPRIIKHHDDSPTDDSASDEDIAPPPTEAPPENEDELDNRPDVYLSELPSVEPPQEYEHSLEDLASMDMLDLDDVQSISEMLDWTLNATM